MVNPQRRYAIRFMTMRTKDRSPLVSATVNTTLNVRQSVRTNSVAPSEESPALPQFTATLTRTVSPQSFQLVTKIVLREATRNKKGKLKVSTRNLGALLPIRLGETQTASPANDPVLVEVRVDQL